LSMTRPNTAMLPEDSVPIPLSIFRSLPIRLRSGQALRRDKLGPMAR
jgi:hypothetical protein